MSNRSRLHIAFLTLLLTLAGTAGDLNAQTINDIKEESIGFKTPILSRFGDSNIDPFSYRGEPIQHRSFLIWPNLTLKQVYNDNVLATSSGEEGDFGTFIHPELIVKREFGRHEFITALNADIHQYYDQTTENVENYRARIEADIEVQQGINIPLKFSYRDGHLNRQDQTRASANDIPVNPLRNQNTEFEGGIVIKPNRLSLTLLGNYRQGRLENGELGNGTILVRNNRDVNKTAGLARIGYEHSETFNPFIEYSYSQEDYINEAPNATSRDNDYKRISAGSFFNYRGLITGGLALGWENRSYKAASIGDANGLSLEGRAIFNPTEKTQIGVQLKREQIEDNVIAAGVDRSFAKFNLTHELRKNFFATGGLSYESKDFENINREDRVYNLDLGFNYIISPRWQVGTEYQFMTRDSDLDFVEMDNSILFLRARFAL